jgi:EmrB/QacA subfamily drug resistance transporter
LPQSGVARHPHPSALLVVLCVATFMTGLDVFIVNVALRPIGAAFGQGSLSDLSWILNSYAIVFAAVLVPAGRLADRYGTRLVFLLGLSIFIAGSLGSALSDNLWLLVALRCLQAIGAAALVPTSLGLLLTGMPPARVHRSIQIWSISTSMGAAAGPAIGGLLVQLSWRWVFIINIPIGLAALVLAIILAPNARHNTDTKVPDLLGGALLIVGIGALSLALVQGPTWGWGSGATIGSFVVAAAALALFVFRSARAKAPVVDLHLFRNRVYTWSSIAILVQGVGFGIQLLGLVLWFQEAWGWPPVLTGLALAPGPAMVSVTALSLRRFTTKMPLGIVASGAMLIRVIGGLLIIFSLTAHPDYFSGVLPGWLLIGAGAGLSIPNLFAAATSGLAPHQSSTGSAVVQMSQQIGSVLGVSLLVVLIGSSSLTVGKLAQFTDAWWWAVGFTVLAALACVPLMSRSREAHHTGDRASTAPAVAETL